MKAFAIQIRPNDRSRFETHRAHYLRCSRLICEIRVALKINKKFFSISFLFCLLISGNQIVFAEDLKIKSQNGSITKEYDPNTGLTTQFKNSTEDSNSNFACLENDSKEIIVKFKSSQVSQLKTKTLFANSTSSLALTEKEVFDFLRKKHKHYAKKVKKLFTDSNIKSSPVAAKYKQRQALRLSKLRSLRAKYQLEDIFLVKIDSQNCLEQKRILHELNRDPSIEYAEPDFKIKLDTTNDYFSNTNGSAWSLPYSEAWGLEQVEAQQVWDQTQGAGVIVTIIDTGVDYNHPDLWNNIWVNPALISDVNFDGKVNLDDADLNHNKIIDSNEVIAGMFGRDFVNGDYAPIDDSGHGTHVAGTIAAVANNQIGIAGIAPQAQILPIKILNASGSGYLSTIAQGLQYTIDLYLTNPNIESMITNNSYGGSGVSQLLEDTFNQAKEAGIISVVAAGNSNADAADTIPASYDSVITVGSVGYNKIRSGFSNYGSVVDIAAPGGGDSNDASAANILSTISLDSEIMRTRPQYKITDPYSSPYFYARLAGTSMAAPHVAGVAALVKSKHPEFNPDEVQNTLVNTSKAFTQNNQTKIGSGIVNANGALAINTSYPLAKIIDLANPISGTYPINFLAGKSPNGNNITSISLEWSQDLIEWKSIPNISSQGTSATANFDTTQAQNSEIYFRLTVIDILGQSSTVTESTQVENFKLTHPLPGDITNPHDPLSIRGSFNSTEITNFKVLYRIGTNTNWHEEAITIDSSKIGQTFVNEEIAKLDSTRLNPDEVYSIKLVIEYASNHSAESEPVNFYIDSKLKQGFPIYFSNRLDALITNPQLTPIAINIDEDQAKELIAIAPNFDIDNGYRSTLKAWKANSQVLWSKTIMYPKNLVGMDVDNDDKGEIFYDTLAGTSLLIHSLNASGTEKTNFPVVIQNSYLNKMKLADIDNDQNIEIISIISSNDSTKKSLLIVDARTGTIEKNIIINAQASTGFFALGNLDNDLDLEIIYHIGDFAYTKLSAINPDGSPVSGWPVNIASNIITLDNIEVEDLDNDGFDEVVCKAGSIITRTASSMSYYNQATIFDHNGNLVKLIQEAPESSFSFSDIDGNGEKDILFTNNYGFNLGRFFAVNKSGDNLSNWPLTVLGPGLRRANFESRIETILVSDINNDNQDDLLFSFAGLGRSFYNGSSLIDSAGIFALNKDRSPIDLNPRSDSNTLVLGSTGSLKPTGSKWESSSGVPVITDLEGDGFSDIIIAKDYEYGFESQAKLNNYEPLLKAGTLIYAWDLTHSSAANPTPAPDPSVDPESPSEDPSPEPEPSPTPNPPSTPAPTPTPPPSPSPPSSPGPSPTPAPANQKPSASFSFSPTEPVIGETVSFDASLSTDSDGTINLYQWDFNNDGVIDATGKTVSHIFDSIESFTTKLTVTDNSNGKGSMSASIAIKDKTKPIDPLDDNQQTFTLNRSDENSPLVEINSLKKDKFTLAKFLVNKTAISEGEVLNFALSTTSEFYNLISFGPNNLQSISAVADADYIKVKLQKRNKFRNQYGKGSTVDIPVTLTDLGSGYSDEGVIRVHI